MLKFRCKPLYAMPVAACAALFAPLAQAWVDTATKALPPASSITHSAVAGSTPLHLIVSLQLRNQSSLDAFLKNQHTAGSPQYGVTLTPDQFAAAYAPSTDQAQAVTAYLAQSGFSNIQVAGNRLLVTADGTAAVAQRAFNTQLVQYQVGGQTVYSNASAAQVPDSLAGTVLAVQGLQNVARHLTHRQMAQRFDLPVPAGARAPATIPGNSANPTGATLTSTYTAADFRKAYDADAAPDGSGTTVAIISGGTDLIQVRADLQQAERDAGLPYVPTSVVQLEPVPNPQTTDNDGEWDLDSQSASGMAYNVKQIIFYNGASLDTGITLGANQFAVDNKAKALNISIGGCEALDSVLGEMATVDQSFKQAVAQGQTVFVSAGDAGAACGVVINLATPQSGVPQQVEYPASSPYVVAVGGTSLFVDSSGNYALETAWTATGGGNSLFEAAPDWQASSGAVPAATAPLGLRGVPDVAMNAGFNLSPVAAFYSTADTVVAGRHESVIGTSLSSPLSMGVWARIQSAHCNSYGFAAPMFYGLDTAGGPLSTANGFTDVILGSNGGYAATVGWDYTTGFGSFDVKAVNSALSAKTCPAYSAPTAALSASAASGKAPVAIRFDGSRSSAAAGDSLDWYVLDFGDGSPVAFSQSAAIPAHTYSAPGKYVASLTVRDAHGRISAAVTQPVTISGTPLACVAPGVLAITNSAAPSLEAGVDPQNGNGSDFLRSVSIGEPGSLSNKLVFTMKVDSLSTVPSPYRWVTYFTAPDGTLYYASMDTNDGVSPSFTYGIHGFDPVAGVSTFQQLGTLDASSNYNADGTIILVLDKAATGLTKPLKSGDRLSSISASVRLSIPDDPSGTVGAGAGLTVDGAGDPNPYVIVGNDTCNSSGGSSSGGSSSSSSSSSGGGSSSSSSSGGGTSSSSGSSGGGSSSSSSSSSGGSGSSSGGTQAPTASLRATPVSGTAPLAVSFDATASSDPNSGGGITSYAFNFGDGGSTTQSSGTISHTYNTPGSFTATVTVTDKEGGSASSSAVIRVQSAQSDTPSASLAVSTTNGAAPLAVQFDASGSRDANGNVTGYAFNFGDGSAVVSQATSTTSHTYTAAGTYQASVTVTNNFGNSSAAYVPIQVSTSVTVTPANGPVAELVLSPNQGAAPLTVTLDGSHSYDSSGASISSYRFDFGDGSAAVTQSSPTINHVYTAPGSYNPSLTVTDSNGVQSAAVVATAKVDPVSSTTTGGSGGGSSGGGAFGGTVLLPLLLGAALRRKRSRG